MSSYIPDELEPMPDVIDQGCRNEQRIIDSIINEARNKAEILDKELLAENLKSGDCKQCGEDRPRLVKWICCFCRTQAEPKFKL